MTTGLPDTSAAGQPNPSTVSRPGLESPGLSERVVVLDPGHNGGNGSHPAIINAKVPDGRGNTKACNTTGTSANNGYAEHEFTWDVAVRVRDLLTARGIRVVMTRDDDTGVGPCVDQRAELANSAGADAIVSIHADGATGANAHGFHVAHSSPPLNDAQGDPSLRLATTLRDTFVGNGFTPSTYIGSHGLNPRPDLAGLNFAERPAALVECGNMRHPADAAIIESPDGRARLAATIATAIIAYLG
ncbi:N-acetylmuramoyl-L-alanine amidase [Nocardia uniformis]|nr:N-acetylmuramoyl-L-alanine amidase [Nocardia uniformis]